MSDAGLPLMPVMVGGPSAPLEGKTDSAPAPGAHEGGVADTFKATYYSSPVVTPMIRALGHFQDPTPVSHDDAVKTFKAQGLDPDWIGQSGTTQGVMQAEAERQSEIELHTMRANRADAGTTTQLIGAGAAMVADPSSLVFGPAAKVLGGMARVGLAARTAIGAATAAGVTGASESAQQAEAGHDPDLASWQSLHDMTIGALVGGAMHGAFGPRPLIRPGTDLTSDAAAALERTSAFAKAHNVSPDEVVSHAGAVGVYQVEPSTARGFGLQGTDAEITEQLKNPEVNKQIAEKVILQNAQMFPHDPEAQAVAYNYGPGRAREWIAGGRDDSTLPKETQDYLARLRGTPLQARVDTLQAATQQIADDNEVDVQPLLKRSALTIPDDHESQTQSIFSEAATNAAGQRDNFFTGGADTQQMLRLIDAQPVEKTAPEKVSTTPSEPMQPAPELAQHVANDEADAKAIAARLGTQEGAQPLVYEKPGSNTIEGMPPEDYQKAVAAAVRCGLTKGIL